jgi:NAD(P)-dependent dehydrogenase (short-subunit alcohol dehydrogenase family)
MKQAIITGGANGLGAMIARFSSGAGYRVGIIDIDGDRAAQTARSIENAVGLTADVSNDDSVEAAFDQFGETPDLLVNNAGLVRFGSLLEQTSDDFRDVVNVNLIGAYVVSRIAVPRMAQSGGGVIVNITSVNGVSPATGSGAYAAAKAGLAMLTQQMAIEFGPLGVRVNAVAPGFINAGMSAPIYADAKVAKVRAESVPLKRLGEAEDVAKAVMFLASDESDYINGVNLVVDGGVVNTSLANLRRE